MHKNRQNNTEKKPKKSFFGRPDGRRVKGLCPMCKVSPYIMSVRSDSQNFLMDSVCIDKTEEYLRKKREEGLKGFGMLHVIVAAYIRTVSQQAGLNRFISGQKIYARNNIRVCLAIKQSLSLNAPETVIKCTFMPDATADDVYRVFTETVEANRCADSSNFDNMAKLLNYVPGLVLKTVIGLMRFLDYFGLLPKFILDLSPFHASFFITSMGSLGIPPIFHHLYNFGNVPIFCSFGAKKLRNELEADGTVSAHKYVDLGFVLDERICDGHYYASGLKTVRRLIQNPFCLDNPPDEVIPDID